MNYYDIKTDDSGIERIVLEDRIEYRLNGVLHRDQGPAVERKDKTLYWFYKGKRHREDGPAIVYPESKHLTNGKHVWYQNGVLHREDGPAISNHLLGWYEWRYHGKLHREDGPATMNTRKGKFNWYLYGEKLRFNEWLDRVDCTPEEKTILSLKWR